MHQEGRRKTALFGDNIILYVENPKEYIKKIRTNKQI